MIFVHSFSSALQWLHAKIFLSTPVKVGPLETYRHVDGKYRRVTVTAYYKAGVGGYETRTRLVKMVDKTSTEYINGPSERQKKLLEKYPDGYMRQAYTVDVPKELLYEDIRVVP